MTLPDNKICLLGPTYPYRGGIAHHTTLLCQALRKEHEVLFISFSRQYPKLLFPGRSDRDVSSAPLRAYPVEYLLDSMNPLTWLRTARRIVAYKPDVLIMPWWVVFWVPQFATVALQVKRKSATRVHFICHNVVEHESSPIKTHLSRKVLSMADRIVTQSKAETDRVKQLLGDDAPVVTAFHPTYAPLGGKPIAPDQARKKLGLSGKVLLFFGFVRPYKGLDILLDAMPEVISEHDVTLLVVGEFWKDKQNYLKQISDLGIDRHVRIMDEYVPNEDISLYFAAADLVVQPYKSATGSGICQLAYGLGKPVIATSVGNLDEVIQDGINGRLVPPGDAQALARAVNQTLEPGTLSAMTNNAERTKERFSWDKLADMLVMEGIQA